MSVSDTWRLKRLIIVSLCWLIIVVMSSAFVGTRMAEGTAIDTNMLNLLPEANQFPHLQTAIEKVSQRGAQKIVLLVASADKSGAAAAMQPLNEILEEFASPLLYQSDTEGRLVEQLKSHYRFYAPYRWGLLSDEYRLLLRDNRTNSVVDSALQALYSPVAAISSSTLIEDPLFTFSSYLTNQQKTLRLQWHDGRPFIKHNNNFYFLYVGELRKDAFDIDNQTALNRALAAWYGKQKQTFSDLTLIKSGAVFIDITCLVT